MLEAKDMRKIAEQAKDFEANDFYFNKLEKRLEERIKNIAEKGSCICMISYFDVINADKWMDNPDVILVLKEELGKFGYQVKNVHDRDEEYIAISW